LTKQNFLPKRARQLRVFKKTNFKDLLRMDKNRLKGTHTALISPMLDGKVNFADLERHVERQIASGINGLVPCGTTGESPTLSPEEHQRVVEVTVKASAGRTPVIAGTGANSTAEALHLTKAADEAGADAFLLVAPYYNKPSQEGLLAHFGAIAEITEKPIVLYSIPSRCGIEISTSTVARLYEKHPHICAIKEAGGRSAKVSDTAVALGSDYVILSGDDALTLPFMACGASGVISVASNIYPVPVAKMVELAEANDFDAARKMHLEYLRVFGELFIEPNPVPAKFVMKTLGMIESDEVRLPLCNLQPENSERLAQLVKDFPLD
jgi:4-hydroxy-tetrahydrodipicolinate synthase